MSRPRRPSSARSKKPVKPAARGKKAAPPPPQRPAPRSDPSPALAADVEERALSRTIGTRCKYV